MCVAKVNRMGQGDRWERKYRNHFDDEPDFKAIRLPSSGSATKEDLPDLHVWHVVNGSLRAQYAFEIKALTDANRLTNEEIEALRNYAHATASTPRVLAHLKHYGGFVFRPDELHSTEKGYTLRKGRDFDGATTIDDFVGYVKEKGKR